FRPMHAVSGCDSLTVNDHDGPKSILVRAGKYILHQSFCIAAHSDCWLCKKPSAEFAPDPALDPLWISHWEPFPRCQERPGRTAHQDFQRYRRGVGHRLALTANRRRSPLLTSRQAEQTLVPIILLSVGGPAAEGQELLDECSKYIAGSPCRLRY